MWSTSLNVRKFNSTGCCPWEYQVEHTLGWEVD